MYSLYLDKPTEFSCEVSVKNASLKNAFARLIVEAKDGISLMFPGELKDGQCNVRINRLKGLLDENSTGKVKLEVIVEDTYFSPWSDNFLTEEHTSVKVQVKEQTKKSDKPILEVKVKENAQKLSAPANHLVVICERFGINKKNFGARKSDFKQIIKEYFKGSPAMAGNSKKYIQEAISALK
jgi:hypothetical protein